MMGEQFVTGADDRRGARQRAARCEARGLPLFLRHARRGGADRAPTRSATAPPTSTRSTRSARPRPAAASTTARASRSSCRRCIRATARAQRERVMAELLPARCAALALLAQQLRHRPQHRRRGSRPARAVARPARSACASSRRSRGWNGIGFVVQAYQKRCPFVIDCAGRPGAPQRPPADGAAGQGRLLGQRDQARAGRRARRLSRSSRARSTPTSPTSPARASCSPRRDAVYPQFATHNAHTLARDLRAGRRATSAGQYEFQCLHGMGEPLYEEVVGADKLDRPCRIYAPVGTHETLLAYLVRRLLENGANTSFVNRIADAERADRRRWSPIRSTSSAGAIEPLGAPHPAIAAAARPVRRRARNSRGLDLADERSLRRARRGAATRAAATAGAPRRCSRPTSAAAAREPVRNPADQRDVVGTVREADAGRRRRRAARGRARRAGWAATPPATRAAMLERAADLLEARLPTLIGADRARGRQDARRTPSPKCARRSTSCATTRAQARDALRNDDAPRRSARSSASARGTSRSRSSPARSPRRSPPATRCSPSRPSRRR